MLVAVFLVGGAIALWLTPREEEPQIVVPMADVYVRAPGLPVGEVERQIATRLEKLLTQIDGVEYVYSMSRPEPRSSPCASTSARTARTAWSRSTTRSSRTSTRCRRRDELGREADRDRRRPDRRSPRSGASARSAIDDYALRRIAEEVEIELQAVPEHQPRPRSSAGGPRAVARRARCRRRWRRADLRPRGRLGARRLERARPGPAASTAGDREFLVDAGELLRRRRGAAATCRERGRRRARLPRDVARIEDGPDEPTSVHLDRLRAGRAATASARQAPLPRRARRGGEEEGHERGRGGAARRGAPRRARAHAPARRRPRTRDPQPRRDRERQGERAGRGARGRARDRHRPDRPGRSAGARRWSSRVAVPITFSLTLLVNYALGYTINRVTLFALILSLGLVVDDPIVDVENIYRHLQMRSEPPLRPCCTAVNEVRPPILFATLAVIVSFVPMFFITGHDGPLHAADGAERPAGDG